MGRTFERHETWLGTEKARERGQPRASPRRRSKAKPCQQSLLVQPKSEPCHTYHSCLVTVTEMREGHSLVRREQSIHSLASDGSGQSRASVPWRSNVEWLASGRRLVCTTELLLCGCRGYSPTLRPRPYSAAADCVLLLTNECKICGHLLTAAEE